MEAAAASVVGYIGTDLIILFGMSILLALSALRMNIHIPTTLLLSLLLTVLTTPLAASTLGIGTFLQTLHATVAFAGIFFVWGFVIFRLLTLHIHEEATLPGALLMGVSGTVGIYALWLNTTTLQSLYTFSAGAAWLPPESMLLWALGALIAMGIAHKQRRWL